MDKGSFEPLLFLLKAPSKEVVVRLCNEAFLHRNDERIPDNVLKSAENTLTLKMTQCQQLFQSLISLVKVTVFHNYTELSDILSLFPDDFHSNLRDLLAKILLDQTPKWRQHAMNNLVSLPQLVDFDWRVDLKVSSDSLFRMAVPTCLLQLKVQENASCIGKDLHTNTVNIEMSKETLDTMLDGLGKIRDQLNSVVNR